MVQREAAGAAVEPMDEKRLRIMNRATRSFLQHGFDRANLEDIAIAAGISKVTIYRYFNDKADLFESVVVAAVKDMAAPLREFLDQELPIEQVLVGYGEFYILRQLGPVSGSGAFHDMARILVGATAQRPDMARRCSEIFRQDIRVPLVAYFEHKIATGQLSNRNEGTFIADLFVQMLFFTNAVALDRETAPKPENARDRATQLVRIFLHGTAA